MNRGNGRHRLFDTPDDYRRFLFYALEALERVPMRIFGYCIMPNHWHLLLQPYADGDLTRFAHLLTSAHARRLQVLRGAVGTGHIYQGRFKSFPIESPEKALEVGVYIDRNPVRAALVAVGEAWLWSSMRRHCGLPRIDVELPLEPMPGIQDVHWQDLVNGPQNEAEVAAIRQAVSRNQPYGEREWSERAGRILRLQSTQRPVGRPRTDDRQRKTVPDPVLPLRRGGS